MPCILTESWPAAASTLTLVSVFLLSTESDNNCAESLLPEGSIYLCVCRPPLLRPLLPLFPSSPACVGPWTAGDHVRVSSRQTNCCLSGVGGWIKACCSPFSLSQWLDSISRPASITHTLMSLKLPSSPAFYRCCLSHTGGWTHLFNPDLSFRHYEIVLSSFFFFLPLPFFFPSPNSPLPDDIGLRQRFSSSCSTNFLTLFGVTIFFGPVAKPKCHVSLHLSPRRA